MAGRRYAAPRVWIPRSPVVGGLPARGALRTRDQAGRRVHQLRTRSELVDAASQAGDVDRRRARSLLAGGIAFRVVIWFLPAALFVAGVTGLFRLSGSSQPDRVARSSGLGASVAAIVRQATRQSHKGPAVLLAIGLVLMLHMSMSLIRALRVAFVLAWEEPFCRRPHLLRDGAILSGVLPVGARNADWDRVLAPPSGLLRFRDFARNRWPLRGIWPTRPVESWARLALRPVEPRPGVSLEAIAVF